MAAVGLLPRPCETKKDFERGRGAHAWTLIISANRHLDRSALEGAVAKNRSSHEGLNRVGGSRIGQTGR